MFYQHLKRNIEALLFISGNPLSSSKIAEILTIDVDNVKQLLEELKQDMQAEQRGLTIVEVAGGYQICVKPDLVECVNKLVEVQEPRLSMAALECLAIIAYKQPVTKQYIEQIRGVNSDRIVNRLLELELIKEAGRKDAVGRPILYCTTPQFLQCFGLKGLEDLPPLADFLPDNETKP